MKIVVIGGGTGSFTVLSGLKKYPVDITAIATMFDSGGSTGRLRDEFGILPPGDIRRCLVALADERDILRKLFMYRFESDGQIGGHSFGNLFLAALSKVTGSETEAIKTASRILRIKGKVLPVSTDNCELCAELEDGQIVRGEANIDVPKHDGDKRIKRLYLEPQAAATKESIDAILRADAIVLGPGDLYTSIISNLVVGGIAQAIRKSRGKKIYVCNLMTKRGETSGFSASEHASEVEKYLGCKLDNAICNITRGKKDVLDRYKKEGSYPVEADEKELLRHAKNVVMADLISEPVLIRHDPEKLSAAIIKTAQPVIAIDLDDTIYSRTEQVKGGNIDGIRPFDGVKEFMELSARKILVTRGDERLQREKIKRLGLFGFDEVLICATDEQKKEIFSQLMERHGKDMIVIGNRRDSEIRYARQLGLACILLKHGHYNRLKDKDKFETAEHEVESFRDVLGALRGYGIF